jgi:rhomboid family GlyGly-CTERM serine protease
MPVDIRPLEPVHDRGLAPVAAGLLLAALLVAVAGEPAGRVLRYERDAVLAGQAWRLLTAHLVHLGWVHLALNAAGGALIVALLGRTHRPAQWLALALVSSLGVSAGLLLGSPHVAWYVGLSGVLHGVVAAGAAALAAARVRAGPLILLVLAAKLAWEQVADGAGIDRLLGGTVIVDAHLYGALAGLAGALALAWAQARRARP